MSKNSGSNLVHSGDRRFRAGIVGIERQLESQARTTERNISEAFRDLSSLIEMAKPMVALATGIANKMKEKQGAISDDETVLFRQQLLNLGVKDPVTKSKYGSGNKYFQKLATELCSALSNIIKDSGGLMSLVEVYCRLNRARGVHLVSPSDLVEACKHLNEMNLSLKLRDLGNNVLVLQHEDFSDDTNAATAASMAESKKSITVLEYANAMGVPFIIAKQSLLLAEHKELLCRDETDEGIRFYPNIFLSHRYR